jgi:NAD(P)H-dependent FMN reductase
MPHLLTVSGSLREGSSNATLLAAAASVAPPQLTVSSYGAIAELPAFNPDVDEAASPPPPVAHWRAALAGADLVLISSPEYAHGMPGALKNALDWVVGSGELVGKPVGILNASSASRFAHPQLIEVLTVMSATIVPGATLVVDTPRRGADAAQLVADPTVAEALRAVHAALLSSLQGS